MPITNSLLKSYESKIVEIQNIDAQYLLFKCERPKNFNFNSGQYASIEINDDIGTCEFLYSIASSSEETNFLEFCIQVNTQSRASTFWRKLKIGELLRINNLGGTEMITDYSHPIVMIAGGSGIAPFRAIIHDLFIYKKTSGSENITLIYGVKKSSAMPYQKEFKDIEKQFSNNLKLILSSEEVQDNTISKGNLITAIETNITNLDKKSEFYICGSLNMIQTVKDKLIEHKIPSKQIFHEY
ncbi:FAD-dependent oxidoreductase [Pigmentibacter sp. JX0631]|uniref:FAD-dependent oxidoreductase n=1 Tax=Pigmentibacter sp. JX0631 TaxID=2976982 RepID=UPI002468B139|nr:FAD-dependent oxidoreductase [Pigmentibacter sp. JX0631]WGL61196.1 FAD-dependent oxidoreductase [Pigmentibacter sp. JX0631]